MSNITSVGSSNYNLATTTETIDSVVSPQTSGVTTNDADLANGVGPAYSLAGSLATLNQSVLSDSTTQTGQVTKATSSITPISSLSATPAYALSVNLATQDSTLLQSLSTEADSSSADDTLFYNQSNDLNFVSSSTFKNLEASTNAKNTKTSTVTPTAATTTEATKVTVYSASATENDPTAQTSSVNKKQFNPVDPFGNSVISPITATTQK